MTAMTGIIRAKKIKAKSIAINAIDDSSICALTVGFGSGFV
jgi:hypothetical protein